jgi:hypothetical protein
MSDESRGTPGSVLTEAQVKSLLRAKGVSTTDFRLPSRDQLAYLDVRFPVAVKVCSPQVLHKTEVGGVFLDVPDLRALEERYDLIMERFPDAQVLVESMEPRGPEAILGVTEDHDFGPSIMFGMGGVMAELYKDVTFRTLPISRYDALEMTEETKVDEFFKGFRGMRADRESVVRLLLTVSEIAAEMSGALAQLDLNPIILRENGYVVVDAKMIMRDAGKSKGRG